MSRQRKGLRAVLREITHSADRSPLFWWMVENHNELVAAAEGRRLQWPRLCARFAELNLTDATGKVASEETARSTWRRARREVAEARQRLEAKPPPRPGAKYPSRISPDWRPQVVSRTERGGGAGAPAHLALPPPSQSLSTAVGVVGPRSAPIDIEAPFEFPTVGPDGNPIAAGRVFYQGRVMTRHAAEELEKMKRALRAQDRGV